MVTYSGDARPLSKTNREFLELLGKTRNLDFLAHISEEIKIEDSDGRIYWIPIQKIHLEYLKKEMPVIPSFI